jgi:hypothetical protein
MRLASHVDNPKARFAFLSLMALFSFYSVLESPLAVVYGSPLWGFRFDFDLAVSAFFLVVFVVKILGGAWAFTLAGQSARPARKRGSMGRLFVDALSAFPFELLLVAFPAAPIGVRAMQIFRVVRVWNLFDFFRQREVRQHSDHGMARLLVFLFWFLLAANVVTCGWLFLGGGNIDATLSDPAKYIRAFYWCITTLATVGYGDITPVTISQTAYATGVMILGVAIYGYVISSVTTLLSNIDVARNQYIKTMEKVNSFCSYNELPEQLQKRIRSYHEYIFESRLGYKENDVLSELPDSIKSDVAMFLHRELLSKVPMFRTASENVIREIVLELEAIVVPPGDYVFRAGDEGEEMYFIRKGIVNVHSPDGKTVFATLSDGAFFGEVALLFRQPRNASIRAEGYVDLYVLKLSAVEKVMNRYPEFAAALRAEAEARRTR